MGLENDVCPQYGKELAVTVPAGHRLVRIVQDPHYDAPYREDDKKCVTQMSRCPHCKDSFGAVTRDET